jgi:hypothetical protein
LRLWNEHGENVNKLADKISAIYRSHEGANQLPDDVTVIICNCLMECTVDMFKLVYDDIIISEAELEDEDEVVNRPTILERNNAIADNPMQLKLAKKSTCQSLVDYAVEVQNKALNCDVEDECWTGVKPILEDVSILLSCDGAPATMVAKSKLKDPDGVPVGIDAGGFHLLLASCKALGNLFSFSHMATFFGCWRRNS